MPRKAFLVDIEKASASNIPSFSSIAKGGDDGSVYATFNPYVGPPIEIELMVQPDVGSYPAESFYMIFSRSTTVPDGVGDILATVAESTMAGGLPIGDVLATISQKLQRHLAAGSSGDPYGLESDVEAMDIDSNHQDPESESDEFYGQSDQDDFNMDGISGGTKANTASFTLNPGQAAMINHRIKKDLRAARFAGFKVGVLIGMKAESVHSLLSLSIQVAKLGLSEEAMQAWSLEPQEYIIFLIRFSNGYKTFDTVIEDAVGSLDISFRIGISNKYKPTITEALAAFTEIVKDAKNSNQESTQDLHDKEVVAGFTNMFVSSSLNELINTRFLSLLKIRNSLGVGWDGAKSYFNDKQGKMDVSADLPAGYYEDTAPTNSMLPTTVTADHLSELGTKTISLPLIAMQFGLRYLTRCTEFCLVCHDKIKEDFEALKPYVCEKPLCLYQYMNLGFGPSVEHEILTQPYVVDLLVSFCYTAAKNRRIREYPTGMSLTVPETLSKSTSEATRGYYGGSSTQPAPAVEVATDTIIVKFDSIRCELLFEDVQVSPVFKNDWIVLSHEYEQHYRVEDVSLFPTVRLSQSTVFRSSARPVVMAATPQVITPDTPYTTPQPPNFRQAKMSKYDKNFDDMSDVQKAETIAMLIETMPSIKEMRECLIRQSRNQQPSLRSWKDRISPATLGMLRWIIASNRSCIVQVDQCPGQDEADLVDLKVRLDQRVSNISTDWVQFRFAQGSPDKEQRFLNALREEQANLNLKYPTLFAFHGSALHNWHSIIRSGLDFKETLNGRAYGHGVYHAPNQSTSTGYAAQSSGGWQGSALNIASAMSLNEIVNCPSKFASSNPHLVVQFIDWIQCRYLMVQARSVDSNQQAYNYGRPLSNTASRNSDPKDEVEQDPAHPAKSTIGKVIGVPLCSASISRSFIETASQEQSNKRRKSSRASLSLSVKDAFISDSEEDEDIAFLLSEDEPTASSTSSEKKTNSCGPARTDFVPGSLDQSQLPMLKEPEYATSGATKVLNKALKEVLEVQKKVPLHDLGWYIDVNLIDNVYQWIVELHSFHADLPLAKDMKTAAVTSVVMEMRFPADFPLSPPFLRVIRPRFLPFTQGGGGHITSGGAMCMELLTNSGWTPASSIESILLQVRLAIENLDPTPARLEGLGRKGGAGDYAVGEAMAAYIRACQTHGWTVPASFKELTAGVSIGMY